MPLYKPSELLEFLNSIGAAPRKGLSQNFLIDGNVVRNILKGSGITEGDLVIEIGPGPGVLTEALLDQKAEVIAIEADSLLAKALKRFKSETNSLEIIEGDALKVPLEPIFNHFQGRKKKIKLISNLPYHITTPILSRFISERDKIDSITVMVQEEVGRRMAAKAGSKDYGSLSIFLQFYAEVTLLFHVSRNSFYPAPLVDSSVVRLNLKEKLPDVDEEGFFHMTRSAFQKRRKSLRNSLKDEFGKENIEKALDALSLPILARPEELSGEEFQKLYALLVNLNATNAKSKSTPPKIM